MVKSKTELWKEAYLQLQNGSDIRGIAIETEHEGVNLTALVVQNITFAFVDYLCDRKGISYERLRIGVGMDSRLSSEELKKGVISGIVQREAQAYDCGLASTPAMFMSTVLEEFGYDGAIMITASHLPYQRNGMKFFTKDGGLNKEEITWILEKAVLLSRMGRRVEFCHAVKSHLMSGYENYLQDIIKKEVNSSDYNYPLQGIHIVVDASNGVSGYFERMLQKLGADTSGSICLEPDGMFPNHIPNPENEEAMEAIKKATLASHADLGILFDTDGDRAAVVLSDGKVINKNSIIALMAAILSQRYPNTTVVTDSVTSNYLTEFLEKKLGLKHYRYKRGYKNVINKAIELNENGTDTQLAIETSGHGALKENYFLDDGAYMAVKILSQLALFKKQGKKLQDMIEGLKQPGESKEFRILIDTENYKEYGEEVLREFQGFLEKNGIFEIERNNFEGIRANFKWNDVNGWLLLRMSLHDPMLPLNIEVNQLGGIEYILSKIKPFFNEFHRLSKF